MNRLLPLADGADADERWTAFLARRDRLSAEMQNQICNGCDGCGQRCIAGFTVTRPEWEAVQAYLKTQPAAEVARVLGQEKTTAWPGAEDSGATFTHCRFRDREHNNCFVYPARPTVCRLFGHTHWLPCPIEAVTPVPAAPAAALWNEYNTLERHTWEEWEHSDE